MIRRVVCAGALVVVGLSAGACVNSRDPCGTVVFDDGNVCDA